MEHFKMYPKVKVRTDEEDDCRFPPNDSKKDAFSASRQSSSSQEKENQRCSALPIARILRARVSDSTIPCTSKVVEIKRSRPVNHEKPEVKPCSVPRPRAVLSSPNNDGMIGSRNKSVNERRSILRPPRTEEKATSIDRARVKINMAKPENKSLCDPKKKKMRKLQEPLVVKSNKQKH